jgi:hypothetical protein
MNPRALLVAVATWCSLVGLFLWASGPLRGLFGDVVVIVFCVATLASAGLGTARARCGGMALVGLGLEAFQSLHLVGPDAHWVAHAVLGSTPDPLDVVAYACGAVIALGLERWWRLP